MFNHHKIVANKTYFYTEETEDVRAWEANRVDTLLEAYCTLHLFLLLSTFLLLLHCSLTAVTACIPKDRIEGKEVYLIM